MSAGGGSRHEVGMGLRQIPARADSCFETCRAIPFYPLPIQVTQVRWLGLLPHLQRCECESLSESSRPWQLQHTARRVGAGFYIAGVCCRLPSLPCRRVRPPERPTVPGAAREFQGHLSNKLFGSAFHAAKQETLCLFSVRAEQRAAEAQGIPCRKRRKVPRQSGFGKSKHELVHRSTSRNIKPHADFPIRCRVLPRTGAAMVPCAAPAMPPAPPQTDTDSPRFDLGPWKD